MRRPRPVRWLRAQWDDKPVIVVAGLLALATFAGFVRVEQVRINGEERVRRETVERSRLVCERGNDGRDAAQDALDRFLSILIAASTEDGVTPGEQERIDRFTVKFRAEVLARLDPIDCDAVVAATRQGEHP